MHAEGGLILMVEDDANDVALIKRAFRRAQIANPLRVVADGDQAVAYLEGQDAYGNRAEYPLPCLMLLDLKLPRRSGHEVLEWLQGQEGLKRLVVVVLTGSREAADLDRAYDLGANSYLVKPVAFDALMELVKALNLYWIEANETPRIPQ
jgi:CheY-like chemotaxis protein